ncbi:hypothetical protein L7F22_032894 [Adiantum nelumboides]|nr:hypothetical protein [Adiantum nelumboides]
MTCWQALIQVGLPYGLPIGARKVCVAVFSGLDYVKLQCEPSEHPSASRMVMRLIIELAGKPYFLSASSNVSRITKRLADGYSKGPRCVFSALDCVKLQRGLFEHPSARRITIWLALELAGKPYDLPTSSNASRFTIRFADGCSKGPRCVFSALHCVKLQRGPFEHPSASHITIRLALELAGKPYDLPTISNANQLTIRLADGCSEDPRCVFSALDYVKSQRRPSEHPSASRMVSRLALELASKSYGLSTSSNAKRITKRLVDKFSEGPRCVFSALDCVKLQCRSFKHPSASRITIRLALELVGKSYDLLASSNESRLTIRLADGCSKEHPSTSRMVMRLAIDLFDKPYDLSASSNASRIIKRLTDGCSKGPRCVFSALDSNASRITKRLVDGCSEGPRCVFNAIDSVKLQRGSSEHPSASRITIRLALELASKPYDLPTSSNASRLTIPLADGCSEEFAGKLYDLSASSNASRITKRRCVFNALACVKLQGGPFKHPSASRITIRLALELAGKSYDLPASFNASRLIIRLADGCSEGPRCVFSALNCVKLQRGPFEHPSASCITIRLALEFAGKPYNLPANSNASRLTIWLADGCSKGPRCIFSALEYVKSQRRPSKHPSSNRLVIGLVLELAGKSYDLSANFNAGRITKRLGDWCSKGPRCVFNALNCVKLQHGPSEHPSASRITIRLALELADNPYDLRQALMQAGLPYALPMGAQKVRVAGFSGLYCVKLQCKPSEHPSASRMVMRFAIEFTSKSYDLSASSNASRITKWLADGCSKVSCCVFSALDYLKLQRGHSSTHRQAVW